jgi:hypothetical protein
MSKKKFKVGDRVRFKRFCINCDEDVRVAEGDYGTVVSVGDPRIKNSNDIGVELDVPQYISVYSKDVELAEPTDPRTAFLQELKELLAKYNADIWADGGWDGCCLHLELDNGREKYNVKGGNLTHNEPIKLEDYSEM